MEIVAFGKTAVPWFNVVEWDGNFKDDGALMLICSERDVEVAEYRRVLEECIRYRDRIRVRA